MLFFLIISESLYKKTIEKNENTQKQGTMDPPGALPEEPLKDAVGNPGYDQVD